MTNISNNNNKMVDVRNFITEATLVTLAFRFRTEV